MYLIAGLGNPTRTYEGTRHNIGFEVIDQLAAQCEIRLTIKKDKALYGMGLAGGQKVILLKPQTYMNLSGEAVQTVAAYYKIAVSDVIVVYDDIDLPPGQLRIRKKGSAGGHNGMKNIISHMGTQEITRVKVGIGEKPEGWNLADYVLSRFGGSERMLMDTAVREAADAVEMMLREGTDAAMNRYNEKKRETI